MTNDPLTPGQITDLIRASSLGDTGVRQLQGRTPPAQAAAITQRHQDAVTLDRERQFSDALIELTAGEYSTNEIDPYLARLAEHSLHLLNVTSVGVYLTRSGAMPRSAISSREETAEVMIRVLMREGPGKPSPDHLGIVNMPLPDAMEPQLIPENLRHALITTMPLTVDGGVTCVHFNPLQEDRLRLGLGLAKAVGACLRRGEEQRRLTTTCDQLQTALVHRVPIEQAKGMIANQRGVTPDRAFMELRSLARRHNLKLRDVAERVIAGGPEILRELEEGAASSQLGPVGGRIERR